jgi:hypothetical protein
VSMSFKKGSVLTGPVAFLDGVLPFAFFFVPLFKLAPICI